MLCTYGKNYSLKYEAESKSWEKEKVMKVLKREIESVTHNWNASATEEICKKDYT